MLFPFPKVFPEPLLFPSFAPFPAALPLSLLPCKRVRLLLVRSGVGKFLQRHFRCHHSCHCRTESRERSQLRPMGRMRLRMRRKMKKNLPRFGVRCLNRCFRLQMKSLICYGQRYNEGLAYFQCYYRCRTRFQNHYLIVRRIRPYWM